MALFLPDFATDRRRRDGAIAPGRPVVTATAEHGRRIVASVSREAQAAGIRPGLPLADARAFLPGVVVLDADPMGDAAALARLAEWCGRWSPFVAPDGADGIRLDVTGCAHLFGGEAKLLQEAVARVGRLGFACRGALADTGGAAWGVARFGGAAETVVASGGTRAALAPLPVGALRLPIEATYWLERLGLRRIEELLAVPRPALARRFGEVVARRLDQVLGEAGEPLSPLRPPPERAVRLSFAEPIATAEDLARAMRALVDELCRALAHQGTGARRLELAFYRVDGVVERVAIGTARPSRAPGHLARLFAEKLDRIDPGLGLEEASLAALATENLAAAQLALPKLHPPAAPLRPPGQRLAEVLSFPTRASLAPPSHPLAPAGRGSGRGGSAAGGYLSDGPLPISAARPPLSVSLPVGERGRGGEAAASASDAETVETGTLPWRPKPARKAAPPAPLAGGTVGEALAPLVDRLAGRLGEDSVYRLTPRESHIPERAQDAVPAASEIRGAWRAHPSRPIRLLAPPEPIEATAPVPDDPPVLFRWRRLLHRVRRADGPERIGAEWWRGGAAFDADDIRDYYRVEDESGRRFWLYRAGLYRPGLAPSWFVHGLFA